MGNFFHTPKPKQFKFSPRFYDPEKEEFEQREQRIKEELGIAIEKTFDGKSYRERIRGSFRHQGRSNSKTSDEARRSQNTRLIIMIVVLALIFYFVFYSDFLF